MSGPAPARHAQADPGSTPTGYEAFHAYLRVQVREARQRASRKVNGEMVRLYWQTGREVLARKREHGWSLRETERIAAAVRDELTPLQRLTDELIGQLDSGHILKSTRVAEAIHDLEAVHTSFGGIRDELLTQSACVTGFRTYDACVRELLDALREGGEEAPGSRHGRSPFRASAWPPRPPR